MEVSESELRDWKVGFAIATGFAIGFLLLCCYLLGGRHYKAEDSKNAKMFAQALKHQAQLWRQERERREREHELRLEEQRQKDEIIRHNEHLIQESERMGITNATLRARVAQAERTGQVVESGPDLGSEPERVVDMESDQPRNFLSTLFGSGLPPGSTFSLEEAVQNGADSTGSHASFPSSSESDTPSRTELPPSPTDNRQDSHTSNPMSRDVTMGGLLSGHNQRNTWAAHPGSSGPSHEEDDIWKPASPARRRTSISWGDLQAK